MRMLTLFSKMFNSKLSRKFFLATLSIIFTIFMAIYAFSVPLIEQKVFEVERNSSRLALNNVFDITKQMFSNVEQFREQALDSHKQQLKTAVSMTISYIDGRLKDLPKSDDALNKARLEIFDSVRNFNYGNNDYIWIVDYNNTMVSHPDPRFHNKDYRSILDELGNPILPSIIEKVIKDGEGYYRYKWHRLGQSERLDKISYIKTIPELNVVIGSGVYLDDLDKAVQQKKQQIIDDLRIALNKIKIAKTGYLFIFDSKNKMLVHPNPNISGSNFESLVNPLTKNLISKELKDTADTGDELHYMWDKPDDPNNYVYEKLSLVRYLPEFDWYICSSVYLDELRSSTDILSKRLIIIALLTMLVAITLGLLFSNRITRPLEQLADTALRVRRGDLTASSGIHRVDEVGILASSFDDMVLRLKSNIDTLDSQVKDRTEELIQTNAKAQRMNAVGQLAGGLAHDFNNLLTIILGNLLLIRERYEHVKGLDEFIAPAISSSRRGAKITHRLLAFSRRQPLNPEAVDIDELFFESIKLLKSSLPANIKLSYQPKNPDIHINVDSGQLESVLINLALNARDAMPDGGELAFSTQQVTVDQAIDGFDEPVASGEYVEICVKDTGSGFGEEALQQAFEPFYSTKSNSENSGLGLSMVYGFVKQTNGYISIDCADSKGACIKILLPFLMTVESKKSTRIKHDPSKPSALSNKLFLLVEDDHDVREVVRQQLMTIDINVIESSTYKEAQLMINTLPNLDGMVSDIVLNGSNHGIELAKQLHSVKPDSTILLISGYINQTSNDTLEVEHTAHIETNFKLLMKPFSKNDLFDALLQAVTKVKDKGIP